MRQCFRKFIMLVLSSVMMLGLFISALAEEPEQTSVTGNGQVEGIVKPYVYQVVLPTYVDGVFDFIIDPQRLIEETNAVAYGGLRFEKDATVFFKRSDGRAEEDYSSSSDHINIVNRSNVPIDVLVNVSISTESLGGITMTEDRTFTGDTGASLYMALTDGADTVPVGTNGAYIRATIPAAPEDAFEYFYDQERREYTYGLKKDLDGIQFPEYSFQLTGAANAGGDWAVVGKVAPLITVTWKVIPGKNIDSGEENGVDRDITMEQNTDSDQDRGAEAGENRAEEEDIALDVKATSDTDISPDGNSVLNEDHTVGASIESEESMESDATK